MRVWLALHVHEVFQYHKMKLHEVVNVNLDMFNRTGKVA